MACFVGLDIAKDHIDVCVQPADQTWQADQTEAGLAQLATRLAAVTPTLVVLEATGGYETAVVTVLVVSVLAWRWRRASWRRWVESSGSRTPQAAA